MKSLYYIPALMMTLTLSACTLTPEQQAMREAKRIQAEQQLQIRLAKQCDLETAEIISQSFNPPLNQTEQERKEFEQRYLDKVNQPIFQSCYKLALENYKVREELSYMRMYYDDDFRFGFSRFCYACW